MNEGKTIDRKMRERESGRGEEKRVEADKSLEDNRLPWSGFDEDKRLLPGSESMQLDLFSPNRCSNRQV